MFEQWSFYVFLSIAVNVVWMLLQLTLFIQLCKLWLGFISQAEVLKQMIELAQKEKERKKKPQTPNNPLLRPIDHCNCLNTIQHFYNDLLMQAGISIETSSTPSFSRGQCIPVQLLGQTWLYTMATHRTPYYSSHEWGPIRGKEEQSLVSLLQGGLLLLVGWFSFVLFFPPKETSL